jgi:hypothetical protein
MFLQITESRSLLIPIIIIVLVMLMPGDRPSVATPGLVRPVYYLVGLPPWADLLQIALTTTPVLHMKASRILSHRKW